MTEAVTTHIFISKTLPDKITKVYICKRKKKCAKRTFCYVFSGDEDNDEV